MTPVQRCDQLREYSPHEFFLGVLLGVNEVLDDLPEVATSAILHVDEEILGGFEMFAVVVGDNVGVAQRA